jgi:hypothetical protein
MWYIPMVMMSSLPSQAGTTLELLRSATHYPFPRKLIKIACAIYVVSTLLGLVVSMAHRLPGSADGVLMMVIRAAGPVVNITGALIVREFLWMALDLLDGAIDRRGATAAALAQSRSAS